METNYKIENNLNFNNELLKAICEDSSDDEEEPKCLITNQPLKKYNIRLSCGHSFNYEPLYTDIIRQKSPSYLRKEEYRIGLYHFRCPYCRTISKKLIPYVDEIPNVIEIKGVNYPAKYALTLNNCKYVFKSGKRKGEICGKGCNNAYCKYHQKIIDKRNYNIKPSTNVIIQTNTQGCNQILVSGKRKGELCGCSKLFNNTPVCKRHYAIFCKSNSQIQVSN